MIAVGVQNHILHIDVEGKGTAEYCSELNAYISDALANLNIENVYFNASKATYMDSSFIGLILSVKKKRPNNPNIVSLLNPSDKIVEIFQIMGLDGYVPMTFDCELGSCDCNVEINKKLENSISDIKLLLDSHRNIMETSSENHKRFQLVEKVFQKELDQRQNKN